MHLIMQEQLSIKPKSSMYKLNSICEVIPPCLTPVATPKLVEHYHTSIQTFSEVSIDHIDVVLICYYAQCIHI